MKYAILKNSNGAFAVESEWSDLDKAKAQFHSVCQTHWNAKDVIKATISLVNSDMVEIENYHETITHETNPTVKPAEVSTN